MTPWQAAVLGVVQGLSEFLPISSSAHLALSHWAFGWGDPSANVPFDVALHLGTLLAVLVYFRTDWWALAGSPLASLAQRRITPELSRLGVLAAASVPAAVLGLLFKRRFEALHDLPLLMAATLAGVGFLLLWADAHVARRSAGAAAQDERGDRADPPLAPAFGIGLAQALALVPGVSRSGITMVAGLALGLSRPGAARFSFLLATPAIVGAVVLDLKDIAGGDPRVVATGMVAAAVSGYFAIGGLLRYLSRHGFLPFALYRIALAAVVVALWAARGGRL